MTIGAGSRLGPYEIIAALGAGGMGEVYKARDARLDRTVDTGRLHYAEPAWPRRTWRYNAASASRFNPTAPLAEPDPVSRSRFTFDGRQSGKHGPSLQF